ncbi:hypothetical protein POTOM_057939 [Populus tomentosa]|uniref:CCHC-type domain-containing protein n=1 Tax=Populus tomentosa TaxID=118781 RepID=A0A8X7XW48_POPTO|nr:hypothetical protein POTOM_057939 [Populus tomentosa]
MSTSIPSNTENHLITIYTAAQAPLKLTFSNYASWKIQFETLFIGYDLLGCIDGSKPCPSKTLVTNDITIPNPAYSLWVRQDQLLLNAIVGSLSPPLISFVARTTSSRDAWHVLATTYAKPSHGRIHQVKNQLKNLTKGSMSITDFVYFMKARSDELVVLGAPMDANDLTEQILDGLGEDYTELVRAVQAHEAAISFDELHEKLLLFEASLQTRSQSSHLGPITANSFTKNSSNNNWRPSRTNWRPSSSPIGNNLRSSSTANFRPTMFPNQVRNNRLSARPYLGHCQMCGTQGHITKRCPSFQLVPVHGSNSAISSNGMSSPWNPQANFSSSSPSTAASWLLDSGASHHVTADLNNLSLHTPYTGHDDVMLGDGTKLSISHTGSVSLPTSKSSFHLQDVLTYKRGTFFCKAALRMVFMNGQLQPLLLLPF